MSFEIVRRLENLPSQVQVGVVRILECPLILVPMELVRIQVEQLVGHVERLQLVEVVRLDGTEPRKAHTVQQWRRQRPGIP